MKDISQSFEVLKLASKALPFSDKMKYIVIPYQQYPAPAYNIIINNFATVLGYSPVPYPKYYNHELFQNKLKVLTPYFFLRNIDGSDIDYNSNCFKESYFTQTKIFIDNSCPSNLMLLLTNIYEENPIVNYAYSKDINKGILLKKKM